MKSSSLQHAMLPPIRAALTALTLLSAAMAATPAHAQDGAMDSGGATVIDGEGLTLGLKTARPAPIPGRPKVALVLSGGGARGLSHIGVLKVLNDHRIPVDLVVGTSMGAVIGGSYAAGNPVERIERIAKTSDWDRLLADRPPRDELTFRRKEDDRKLLGAYELGISTKGVSLPRGAIGSHLLEEVLRRLSLPGQSARTLDDLPLPLRTVATDLVSGEMVVLQQVTVFQAMRASMSVPGAFSPLELGDRMLVDGGLVRNLPVDVARSLGAHKLIVVNVGTPLLPREELGNALGVAQQMVNILTEQNVAASLASLGDNDILIAPDLRDITAADFDKADLAIQRGEQAALKVIERLNALSVDAPTYASWEGTRTSTASPVKPPKIASVVVQGTQRANPETLRKELDIPPDAPANERMLVAAMRRLYGRGEFERIDFTLDGAGDARRLTVMPRELPWIGGTLRFGLQLSSDFHDGNGFNLAAAHRMTWVNRWGAEWRNYAQLGASRRLESEFLQPLAFHEDWADWFVAARVAFEGYDRDRWSNGRRVARIDYSNALLGGFIGRALGNIGDVRLGLGLSRGNEQPLISDPELSAQTQSRRVILARLRLDTIDNLNFPRSGYYVDVDLRRSEGVTGGAASVDSLRVLTDWAVSRNNDALQLSLRYGQSRGGLSPYVLGGFLNLTGSGVNEIVGDRTLLMRALWTRKVPGLPRALGSGMYIGAALEAGQGFASGDPFSLGSMRKAASLLVGLDSVVGPLYFGLGRTHHGSSGIYLYLGRP